MPGTSIPPKTSVSKTGAWWRRAPPVLPIEARLVQYEGATPRPWLALLRWDSALWGGVVHGHKWLSDNAANSKYTAL